MQEPGVNNPQQTPGQSSPGQAWQNAPTTASGEYAPIPPPTGYTPNVAGGMPAGMASSNGSGMGAMSVLPEELRGFNWGAFFLNWIWAIAHNTWIGLLALVPYVGFVMAFVLGFKGNEWAWQNRRWDSIEQFRTVQSIWMRWGIAIFIISLVLGVLGLVLGVMGAVMGGHRSY